MDELLDQMDAASAEGRHLIALYIAMTIPDACAGLQSTDGRSSGAKYKDWFDSNMLGGYDELPFGSGLDAKVWMTGQDCWLFRCAILHQARGDHTAAPDKRIAFGIDGMHKGRYAGNLVIFSAQQFVHDMSRSARTWLDGARHSEPVASNLEHSIRLRDGLSIEGVTFGGGIIA